MDGLVERFNRTLINIILLARSSVTSFINPDKNALPLSDKISAGTPWQLTISSTSNRAIVAAV